MQASRKGAPEHQVDQNTGSIAHGVQTAVGMEEEMKAAWITRHVERQGGVIRQDAGVW